MSTDPSFHLLNVYPVLVRPDDDAVVKLEPSSTSTCVGRVPDPLPRA